MGMPAAAAAAAGSLQAPLRTWLAHVLHQRCRVCASSRRPAPALALSSAAGTRSRLCFCRRPGSRRHGSAGGGGMSRLPCGCWVGAFSLGRPVSPRFGGGDGVGAQSERPPPPTVMCPLAKSVYGGCAGVESGRATSWGDRRGPPVLLTSRSHAAKSTHPGPRVSFPIHHRRPLRPPAPARRLLFSNHDHPPPRPGSLAMTILPRISPASSSAAAFLPCVLKNRAREEAVGIPRQKRRNAPASYSSDLLQK